MDSDCSDRNEPRDVITARHIATGQRQRTHDESRCKNTHQEPSIEVTLTHCDDRYPDCGRHTDDPECGSELARSTDERQDAGREDAFAQTEMRRRVWIAAARDGKREVQA